MSGSYYHYEPSLAAATTFAVLFGITTIFHLYQLLRTKTWFWITFTIGGVFETFGFAARAINSHQGLGNMSFATTVVSNIGIVLAPVLFAASVYMTLGRIVLLSGQPDLSIVRPRWLTKLFVLGDVISFLIQAYGVSQLTQDDPETVDTGRTIMVVGLWIQIFFFGFFVVTALLFWFRMSRLSHRPTEERPWKKHLVILVVASTLILIRCVFRVIEYMQGPSGELISNEIYTYVFDAALMLTMMLIFHFFHPSEISCWLYGTKMISFLAVTNAKGLHVEQPREFVGLMERV